MAVSPVVPDRIADTFAELVNMTPRELHQWLETAESREVGQKTAGHESIGHASGRAIVKLLEKKKKAFTDGDVEQMHRVVGYIKRRLAQRPPGNVGETPWAYSLKNWGHDPTKSHK